MLQITGKSVPRRGATLLLALVLGAGLALTGCGDDDSSTTTPAPAPTTPAPPPAPDPVGVPGGLKATGGVGFIEFSWEAVEGATGYEVQLTMTEGDFSSVRTATVMATMHRFDVAAETTGYARVRAHEGERQSDWSETAMGTSMAAPVMLGMPVPTVSSTGPDYIEWSWEPVAGALAYQVQVADSMDGFMDTADPAVIASQTQLATETTYRAEVEPETTMYIRVRAGAGTPTAPIAGEWSATVMGMSEAAPIPFTVSMTPPEASADKDCMGQAFCPDSQSDAKKAMADPNPMMMVMASHNTKITAMFVEGNPTVIADADGDTPFVRLNWPALQTTVAGDGVTFMFQPVTVGAGQEPTAMGDAMYITCGPFRCSEAADESPAAPDITLADSEVCENFEVDLELVKGAALNGNSRTYDSGVDVGWVYTASHAARVTHEFRNVTPGAASMTVPGTSLAPTSTKRSLNMTASSSASSKVNKFGGEENRDEVAYTVAADHPSQRTQSDPGPIRNGVNDCLSIERTGASGNRGPGGWDYYSILRSRGSLRGDVRPVRRPENCVRLVTDGLYELIVPNNEASPAFYNYLPDYSVHVDPIGGVAWAGSSVSDWGDGHAFNELECPRRTFEAADQLDVCDDFEEEVNRYWGAGIGTGGSFRVEFETTGTTNANGKLTEIVIRNSSGAVPSQLTGGHEYRPDGSRHANLWLVDKRPGIAASNMAIDGTRRDPNLYWMTTNEHAPELINGTRVWRAVMRYEMTDVDGDPMPGDFGKIDQVTAGALTTYKPDGVADNMTGDQADHAQCSDADGPGCDATADFELSGTFTRIQDTDSCTVTIEQSITCDWDADGDEARGGLGAFPVARSNNRFISCKAN